MKKLLFLLICFLCVSSIINAQWSNDPAQNNAICDLGGEQAIPKVVTSSTGDTYIGYFSNDSGNYDVRLQRLDSQGNELWAQDGIVISDNPAMSWLTDWDMTVDDDNHAILTFQDIRNGGNNNIYAYRIAPDGSFIWGEDGIELSNSAAFDVSPKVCITSAGYAVITWQSDDAIILQRISSSGTLIWGPNGITLSCADTYSWPQPFAVEDDHILLKFFHDSGAYPMTIRHCYIQKYDNDGNAAWASDTVVSNAGGISAWTQVFPIESDGADGCFIAWHDDRDNNMDASSFIQHVNSDGSVGFTANGVELSTQVSRENYYPQIAFNSNPWELYTYWMETDSDQNQRGLYGQKLDAEGNRLWTDNGKTIIELSATGIIPIDARQANDDVIVCYEESPDVVNAYVKATRLDADGEFVWDSDFVTLCSVASSKVHSEGSYFVNNQIICTWEDDRNGANDIYAQNITFDGLLGIVDTGTIEGSVSLIGGIGNLMEVDVTAGSFTVNPDINGDYSMSIVTGTYEVTASLEYYTPQTISDVVVTEGSATTGIDFTLNWIPVFNPPQNGNVDPNTGHVTWDPPEPYPGAELIGYNIYLDGVFLEFITETSYQLENLIVSLQYTVGITAVYEGGFESDFVTLDFIYIGGTGVGNNIIAVTELKGNYPNPFNPITNITYSIKEAGNVTLEIYNLRGQLVKTLVNKVNGVGNFTAIWNGTDNSDKPVSSGVYFYKMKSGNYTSTKKMILMK
ncbi:MAG: T9SS type A sorting domain-containing protein [Candidatus Cloacimonetes bacterium]|jgi:hypothetical protein|nr:T9SS type A sorting domain-containing protein [Candidatus Cloacimonadota bacterium]